ncbi:uncharacterized protein LOC116174828 isoform X2 [Photinus pyralis]|uniref:uncharacterized protein LOC116174828 isoform X2 n=1 Tax=Photinus pyralis TaxID=7054 RepID=UPI001267107F|nr:uncharacterized protein LOC116174828 isoform X2 [Photinus pyralis]
MVYATICLIALALLVLVLMIVNVNEIKRQTKSRATALLFIVLFPFILVGVAFSAVIYVLLLLYREIVLTAILKEECGDDFFCLVSGLDVFNATQSMKRSTIIGLMVCEIDSNSSPKTVMEYVQDVIRAQLRKNRSHLGKLFTKPKMFSGYLYLERVELEHETCIRHLPTVDGELDVEALNGLIGRWCYEPFNGPLLWDISVGTQPLKWRNEGTSNIKHYPIVIRVHHLIADGISILKLVVGVLGDKSNHPKISTFEKYIDAEKFVWLTTFRRVIQAIRIILFFPVCLFSIVVLKSCVGNEVHGKELEFQEHCAVALDPNGQYLEKVKTIRKRSGATIPEIILTVISESLKAHFLKYNNYPSHTTLVLPIVSNYSELLNMRPGEVNIEDIQFNNRYVVVSVKVPTFIGAEDYNPATPILSKLNVVKRLINTLKVSTEAEVSAIIFSHFFGVLPISWVRHICQYIHATAGISLIPGPPKMTYGDGHIKVCEFVFWLPHMLDIGLTIGSLSYDNRLILSLNCDAVYISERTEVQELLDSIYRHINLLEEELQVVDGGGELK